MKSKIEQLEDAMKLLREKLSKSRDEDEYDSTADYSPEDEDLKGLSVSDGEPEEEGDEASKWLAANEPKPQRRGAWKPNENASPESKAKMNELIGQGMSPREAEYHAGGHAGPKDYETAKRSGALPSHGDISLKTLESLSPHAMDYFNKRGDLATESGGEEANPLKFAELKMKQAHQKATGDYSKQYNDFLASDAVKNLKGRDRLKAISKWKDDYKTANPDHMDNVMQASQAQQLHGQALDTVKNKSAEAMEHLKTAGGGMEGQMSSAEAAQHFGGQESEDSGSARGEMIMKDPVANFAAKNSKLLQHLNDDQKRRMQHVDAAHAQKGITKIRKNPAKVV